MTTDTSARLQTLLDRQDILDCLIRFSRGMDRFDRELFLSAFHADATIAAGSFVGGPQALYTSYKKRKIKAHYRSLTSAPGPRKTAEEFVMTAVLAGG